MENPGTRVLAELLQALDAGQLKIIDLTTTLGPDTPVIDLPPNFAQSPGLSLSEISRYDCRGPAWYWNIIHLGEHTGTHFDAPIHWITGKDLPNNATDTILPRKFIGPACVIDVTADVEQNPDFLLTIERVEHWEGQYGRIPAGAWVLLRTGWSQRKTKEEFLNNQDDGAHSPGFARACSQFLANSRDVLGVGVETVGTDAGQAGGFDPPFPNHTFMHGAGKFGLTSLINLEQLPPTGALVIAAPLKILNGSGSPLRVIAITP
ncbi:cyclase family protein [Ktedonosporobacter rubrisoli]|uniref:Cyclase family protein n=1 Tax=Ktedonosporobacter rubrisoli TaxID=2509675 RepID=A0A4P6JUT3_KTERU|nr:cyclase family protein [Ktedonosporobacter rubrisoli]QBD79254.1 cyclase family protein [Ktedonosporobacter rubrisoli]